jgi:hypothetical protein
MWKPRDEVFSSLWVGDRLLPIANACINSFKAQGFRFNLYMYDLAHDAPDFVEHRDAQLIVPREKIFLAHGGFETFNDLFAYRFLEQVGGWWVDNDVVCNTDRLPDVEIAFAEEEVGIINNAVLRFPKNHFVVVDLLNYIATVDPINSKWGSTGPWALTKIFNKYDLGKYKQKISDFYPLHWKEAPKFLFPEFTQEIIERTANSPFIHLWGAALREIKFDFRQFLPLKGSYLDALYINHLDPHIMSRLRPFDENEFRTFVKKYIEQNWDTNLPL